MQNGSSNEFACSFGTRHFFQRKRDKEDVTSLIVEVVRGIEEKLAKNQPQPQESATAGSSKQQDHNLKCKAADSEEVAEDSENDVVE